MTAYYNEFDPHAAAWLRELIARGLIADGVVDERSIRDVDPDDLKGFKQCHFFAGIGGTPKGDHNPLDEACRAFFPKDELIKADYGVSAKREPRKPR